MESKLLAGTKSIMDKTDQQQIALEQQKQEIIEQKVLKSPVMFYFWLWDAETRESYSAAVAFKGGEHSGSKGELLVTSRRGWC